MMEEKGLSPFISNFEKIGDYKLRCVLNGCPSKIANGLRRVLLAETPVLAFELVEMYVNEVTGLHDEFISHRIGLLPIDSNSIDSFVFKQDCDCEYKCDKCSVSFSCDVKNETSKNISVTTADLISENPNVKCMFSDKTDGSPTLPIVKLAPGQCIKFNAIAHKGIGHEHAKWNPVCSCVCTYHVDKTADKLTQYDQSVNPTKFNFSLETSENIMAKNALRIGFDVLIDKLIRFKSSLNTIKF